MKLTTALRNTRATDIITAANTNPKLKYCTGAETLGVPTSVLATLNITGALGTATNGVIDFNETVTQTSSGFTAGTPTFIQITTSGDAVVATLLIGPGADVTQTGTIQVGVDIAITAGATITEGNA